MTSLHDVSENVPNAVTNLLEAAQILTGSDNKKATPHKDIESVLRTRLASLNGLQVKQLELTDRYLDTLDTEALYYQTGNTAFLILDHIQTEGSPIELSLSNQSALRKLVALVSRWKMSNELESYNTTTPSMRGVALEKLLESTMAIIRLIDSGGKAQQANAPVGVIFQQSLVEFLPILFTVGWSTQCTEAPSIRASTYKFLSRESLVENMQMLGSTLNNPQIPPAAKRSIKIMLGRLILQPKGVASLLEMVFGSEEHNEDALNRYEQTSILLTTPPGGMAVEEYSRIVLPQMLDILLPNATNATYQRAVSFAVSRMLSSKGHGDALISLYPLLYGDFMASSDAPDVKRNAPYTASQAIAITSTLLAMAPPSVDTPMALTLIGPIVEKLYTLLYYLESRAVSDPAEISACKGLLHSWMKISPADGVCDRLWNIVEGHGGEWILSGQGDSDALSVQWTPEVTSEAPKLADLSNLEENAMDDNPLNLRPDPIHLARFVQSIQRDEVSSLFFIRVLASKRDEGEGEPTPELLKIQLLYQLQTQMPSAVLSSPEHAMAFVDNALGTGSKGQHQTSSGALGSLKFINKEEIGQEEQNSELLHSAIDFLLSCLEANPNFVPSSHGPHVVNISRSLKALCTHPSKPLRQVAREASLVFIARQSGADLAEASDDTGTKSSRDLYQEALVLLQDPLLPVRAQGLAMLRHLMEPSNPSPLESALVPAILDIFINSVQDEDSFIFLNAVQGLAAMVQNFGRDIFKRLCSIYMTEPAEAGIMNKQELDVKLRIGEALANVIGKCGQSLGGYVDMLVPVILATIRDNSLPTTLRTSAISLASQCIETSPFAMAKYSAELSSAMLDILELEHSVLSEPKDRRSQAKQGLETTETDGIVNGLGAGNRRKGQIGDLMTDEDPTAINSKLSPLRRSAVHLLTSIIRHFLQIANERPGNGGDGMLDFPVRRSSLILRYLATQDADAVVNSMASEAVGMLLDVGRLRLGVVA